ncbi:hypothetical protein [Microbispora oryzae]|uniref:hypothetical protein n=1 Tax=Microbispora oryzae TaxID=2806554 RepID=UPI0027DB8BF2|nr:hypothetical protein [Microbispora oryzae]
MAAGRALSEGEPERAYEHAKVARRFAARIGVVREAVGIAAYHAGEYAEALGDLRAARRISGSDAYLPIMADCERGLGRPERALDLVRSPEAERLDRAAKIELTIVESGARRDLGQHDAAVITLQRLPELRDPQPKPWSARLAFAYADALADAGHQEAATDWFARAMAFDEDGETDAAERYAELTGSVIEDVEEDFEEDVDGDAADDLEDDVDPDGIGGDAGDAEGRDLPEAAPGDVERAATEADEDDDSEDDEEDGDETDDDSVSAVQPLAPAGRDDADGPAGPADDAAAGEAAASAGEDRPGREDATASAAVASPSSAYGPAFIEPNFGDVVDEPEGGAGRADHTP